MVKRFGILLLTFFVTIILTEPGRAEELPRQGLLRDGFALSSIDGRINNPDGNEWFFELDSDVIDDKVAAKKGTSLQLLPSATLQRIIDDAKIRHADNYCLWGRVTKYKGKNFIFPIYFLPLSKIEPLKPETPREPNTQEQKPLETMVSEKDNSEPNINEPNDILAIPQEVIEKIKARQAKQLEPARLQDTEPIAQPGYGTLRRDERRDEPEGIEKLNQMHRQDTILADRTAFLAKQDDQPVFILDALGRSAPKTSLRLLPCETLELTEKRQSAELEQPTFKIAGIMTEYKGNQYLLLQKATQVYNFGNFAR